MKRAAVPVLVLVAASFGCLGSDADRADDPGARSPRAATVEAPPPLECEEEGFPCTWAEVPPAVEGQGRRLARLAAERLAGGSAVDAVAAELFAGDSVVEVGFSDIAIRFRLEGGRPEWVFLQTLDARLGAPVPYPAAGSSVERTTFDPVKDPQAPPEKSALVMSAFRWQWQLGKRANPKKPADDVHELADLFRAKRDYRAPDGRVVVRVNELDDADPSKVHMGVGIASFFDWDEFNAIHVLTHGGLVSDWFTIQADTAAVVPGKAVTVLATGDAWPQLGQPLEGEAFATAAGVARFWIPINDTIGPSADALNMGASVTGSSMGPFLGVTTDFFLARYPQGLKETVIFLNACHSAEDPRLVEHLSKGGSTVVGWNDFQTIEAGLDGARCFWSVMVGDASDSSPLCKSYIVAVLDADPFALTGGYKIKDVMTVVTRAAGAAINAQPVVAQSGNLLSAGPSDPTGAASGALAGALPSQGGDDENRAVEIVRLLDGSSDVELVDGGFVAIAGTSGDGSPDTLLAEFEVFGIGPSDAPDQMTLHLDVDGGRQSQSYSLTRFPARDRGRTVARLPLDVDLQPGGTIDVEAWLEFPDGKSHWLYEDLSYDFVWRATVAPGPYGGTYVGSEAEAWWDAGGLRSLSLAGVDAGPAPYVYVNFDVEGLGYAGPGTYTPPLAAVEINFSQTPAIFDPQAQLYYLNHGGPDRRSAPWTSTNPPDPTTSTPITLVFDELSGDRVRGHASGTFYHLPEPVEPGFHHPGIGERAIGDVRIDFDVVPCTSARTRAGVAGC